MDENDQFSNLGNRSFRAKITDLKPGAYSVQLVAFNAFGQTEPQRLNMTIDITSLGKF